MGKVTIQNIAKELGFSRNTVSMALKGNDLVAPRTREMIRKYAERVGYLRMPVEEPQEEFPAAEQADGPACHIMILRKPDIAIYWDKVINGISEEACRHHCQTQVAVVTDEAEEWQQFPPGLDERIRAVFCVKMLNREYIEKIRRQGILVCMLDSCKDGREPLGDIVKTEGFHAVMQLTTHLIDQGMRRIGFLNESSSLYETMYDRFSGYLYAMRQKGIRLDPRIVLPEAQNGRFYDMRTFDEVVEGYGELPEAVVCGNDEIAKYLTQALRRKGIRVPEDVAVTGFDNDEEGILDPFFTTVNVDAKWLGKRMVQCFLWRQQYPDAPYEKISVSGEVILRRSSQRRGNASGRI